MPSDYIDNKVRTIAENFLNEHIYPQIIDKDNLLGVVVYGSSLTGFASKNSDIDMLILLREAENTIRGVKQYQGCKMEYFIKPIEKYLSEGVKFSNINCPSHIALEQNGFLLYDQGDFVKNVLRTDANYYNENRQRPSQNFDLKFVQIENRMASLRNILERDGIEYHMVYYNVLEMIRQFHSQYSGEADIPFAKAYRIYTDPEYYDKFVGAKATNPRPDTEFVERYKRCIEICSRKSEMQMNLESLYLYEQQKVPLDTTDYELKLK